MFAGSSKWPAVPLIINDITAKVAANNLGSPRRLPTTPTTVGIICCKTSRGKEQPQLLIIRGTAYISI